MTQVRTTIQPWRVLDVDAAEMELLTRYGVLYTPGYDLSVEFFAWPDGPPFDPDGTVTITITDSGNATVLATTSNGVQHAGYGQWNYRWPTTAQPGPGTYTARWTATDTSGATASAAETFTI